jgi:hypothetical protein
MNARAAKKGGESKDGNVHSMGCHVIEYDRSNMAKSIVDYTP